jgi:hypothetical protein
MVDAMPVSGPLAATVVATALAVAVPCGSARASAVCPPHTGALAGYSTSRIWHMRGSLYGCDSDGRHATTARLGPWSARSRYAWDGSDIAWTVPSRTHPDGDRLWAGTMDGVLWLHGAAALPAEGVGPRREVRVQKVLVVFGAAAWVTSSGDAVLALQAPDDDPKPVGELPGPLVHDSTRVLVGRWPQVPAATLAASARLVAGEGEIDDCGGANPYLLSVRPDPGAAPVGATWTGSWAVEDC